MHILHIQNVTISNLESFRWLILLFWYIFCFSQRVTTSSQRVTILLLEIYIIFNTPTFLVHDQMHYCTCYHAFGMEQVNICTISNALPRVTIKFLKKKYTITFSYNIDGNAWQPVENGTNLYLFLSKCIVT